MRSEYIYLPNNLEVWVQLKTPTHPTRGVPTAVSSLAVLLRIPKMRAIFVRADGIRYLSLLIVPASNQQYIQVSLFLHNLLPALYVSR